MLDLTAQNLLEADPRATFVIELQGGDAADEFAINYSNKAFNSAYKSILSKGDGKNNSRDFEQFKTWTLAKDQGSTSTLFEYVGATWIYYDAASETSKYRIVSVISRPTPTSLPICPPSTKLPNNNGSLSTKPHTANKSLRERLNYMTPDLEAHLTLIERSDWSQAGFGDISEWPPELLEVSRLALVMPKGAAIMIGHNNVMLYNVAYANDILKTRHPQAMATPIDEVYPEGVEDRKMATDMVRSNGFIDVDTPYQLFFASGAVLEERYATWSMFSLGAELNSIFLSSSDVTSSVLEKRRQTTLSKVRELAVGAPDLSSFFAATQNACSSNPYDISFLRFYSVQQGEETPVLETTLTDGGVEEDTSIKELLRRALTAEAPIHLEAQNGSLPTPWQQLAMPHGFQCQAERAVVSPLRLNDGTKPYGLVVMGLNIRRHLDQEHQDFVDSILHTITAYSRSAMRRYEEARFRRQTAETTATTTLQLESFAQMLEMSDVGYFNYDPDGTLRQANNAWYNLSGHPRITEVPVGFSFMDVVYEEDKEIVMAAWNRLAIGKEVVSFEMRWCYYKDNITPEEQELGGQWVVASCLPMLNKDGEVTSITGLMYDISAAKRSTRDALKRAEALEKAKASEERLRLFAQFAPMGIYTYGANREFLYCNDMWFTVLGVPKAPLSPEVTYDNWLVEEDAPAVEQSWQTIMSTKKPVSVQFRTKKTWRSPDGHESQAWIMATSYPLFDCNGEIEFVQGACFDISQFKWAERVEKVRAEDALEAKRQQESFIDTWSHELRNPLSAVVQCADSAMQSLLTMTTAAQRLAAGTEDEVTQYKSLGNEIEFGLDSISTIVQCSSHMQKIIDDILVLSKLDAKLLSINPAPVQAVQALQGCTKMFHASAQGSDIDLQFVVDDSLNELGIDWVQIDASRVNQVAINLLTNAIKFTKTEPKREIRISLGVSKERPDVVDNVEFAHETISKSLEVKGEKIYLWCSVVDTGSGLSQEQQALLFHRFSQAFAPRTHTKYGGSGLGLFISRSLCELQGGEISVYSAGPGQGSTFAFYITAYTAESPEDRRDSLTRVLSNMQVEDPAEQPEYSILIVEDNIVNQKVLSKQLKKNGYIVHVANHGREALDFLQTSRHWKGNEDGVDLTVILMDVEMPIMGGLECAKAIRRLQAIGDIVAHIPIIAVSANARQEQMDDTRMAGMDDAIAKPFRIPDLIPKIELFARRSRMAMSP